MCTTFSTFFLLTTLFLCLASVCPSHSSFAYDNRISLASSNGLHADISVDCDPSFSSIPMEAIYQFGDSISDTGNIIRVDPSCDSANWPYGETFFTKPTGRFSDGLLIIDYFAKFVRLPFIEPYLNKDGNFAHGVNFAIAGATALNASTLKQKFNISATTNRTLSAQLAWFNSHLHSFDLDLSERRRKLSKTLFMMGGIGVCDYNDAFLQGITLPNAYKMVPHVIQAIRDAVEEIIVVGATHIVVPGMFPIGCLPLYLALFKTNDSSKYDELKCLKQYNHLAKFHNDVLQQSILEVGMGHPRVLIVYMDYFGTFTNLLQNAALLGFDKNNRLEDVCCGNPGKHCGTNGALVCENPQDYISWDGAHMTQHVHQLMASQLMRSIFLAFQNTTLDDLKAFQ